MNVVEIIICFYMSVKKVISQYDLGSVGLSDETAQIATRC